MYISGCHIGDCHYIKGNKHAYIRLEHLQQLLKKIGIEKKRFRIHSISASEGKKFSELIIRFTEKIREFGTLKIPKKLGI